MIVVDTNVVCYRWMPSAQSGTADKVLAKDPEWIAPRLWRSEFCNALAGALRRRLIGLDDAIDLVTRAEKQFSGREFSVSSGAVLELVEYSRCSAYDCEFVALALERNVALVTADREVLKGFPKLAIAPEEFVSKR